MPEILEKELSYMLTGISFKVQRKLGRFCKEIQYADEFELQLKEQHINFKREISIHKIQPESPKGNRTDFIVENKIVVELKAKNFVTKEDYFQMQRYLHSSGIELGLIINFRQQHLKPKRILNTALVSDHSDANSVHSDRS